MTFLRPGILNLGWGLVVLALWSAYGFVSLVRARRRIAAGPLPPASRPTRLWIRALQLALGLLLITCIIIALARPQVVSRRRVAELRKLDAVLLLDISPSMRAQDIYPSRLARATEVIASFIEKKLPDDRFGLVSFAQTSLVLSYLTADPNNIEFYLDYLRDQGVSQYGTNIGGALKNAMTVLSRQTELEPAMRNNKRVFILLSDGEDFGDELNTAVAEVIRRGIPVYSVGIGSREGAFIPVGESNGHADYLLDKNGRPLVATFDETSLRQVAQRTGGRYYRAYTGAQMREAFADIFTKAREVRGYREVREPHELYRSFLIAGFLCFILRMLL